MSTMTKGRKLLYWVIILTIVLSLNTTAFAQRGGDFTPDGTSAPQVESNYSLNITKESRTPRLPVQTKSASGEEMVSVIVKLNVEPLATYTGDIDGLPATSPKVTGMPALDLQAADSQLYLDFVNQEVSTFEAGLKDQIPTAEVKHRFNVVLGGVSMLVPVSQLDALAALPGVEAIYPDQLLQLDTDTSPGFLGAPALWNQLGGQESAGEGVIVGILDSGVWPEHPSFSDPDPSGKPYAAPPATWHGTTCSFGSIISGDVPFTCNNKLIGAYRFMSTYEAFGPGLLAGEFLSARDDNGHGSHTASTSAGNAGVTASVFGVDRGTISGIAPRAHVAVYKVCGDAGCYGSDSAAAVQQAIVDGVNVINFSISGGSSPYSDAVELAFLDAYAAGIFVATSAGNSGPTSDTVAHRGPWVTTVAASTTDRAFMNKVDLTADNGDTLTVEGTSVTAGIDTPKEVVIPTGDAGCNGPFAAGTFTDKIVICQRGGIGRVQKGYNVMQGGAVGMILYNPTVQDQETDNHFIPTSHIQGDYGVTLLDFMSTHTGVVATMTAGSATGAQGDVLAAFSSRGGPGQTLGVNKPDIAAPGVQILAGHTPASVDIATGPQGEYFQAIAGTSMASPHIAGSGALLKALHPSWTPGQIKSALMTSAFLGVVLEDGATPATPYDVGSGRVNLKNAGKVSLTFDETAENYVLYEDELWQANYPSLYIPVMPGLVEVKRTVRNMTNKPSTWLLRVEAPSDVEVAVPARIKVAANGTTTFPIIINASTVPLGEARHATLFLKKGGEELHFPISFVRKQPAVTLEKTCDPASFVRGSTTECTLTATNNTFDTAETIILDYLPRQIKLVPGSVSGATEIHSRMLNFTGEMFGASPPDVTIAAGTSPAGYLPLSLFGIAPISGPSDESISNLTVPAFVYGGESYTRIGFVSNGYAVVGGGTSADIQFENQNLPASALPNNVLAPFWTDLNPGAAGAMRAGVLTDGASRWLILDWEGVPEYGSANLASFQIWIGLNGVQDISFTYGAINGNGAGGSLTVGAENKFGNRGQNFYYNGTGTLPGPTTELVVSSVPGEPGETKVITFTALGVTKGVWTNCAAMLTDITFGVNVACFSGEVLPKTGKNLDLADPEEDFTLFMPFVISR